MTHVTVQIRRARIEDVPALVHLINRGGPLGRPREVIPEPLPEAYLEAFHLIDGNLNQLLMVAEEEDRLLGTFQVTWIHSLMGHGRPDCLLESVHVTQEARGKGVGTQMMQWAVEQARLRGCRRVQLTTDKRRHDAHRFYTGLGFTASHEGMKLLL
jgi:GNAT superfamily N-acetyltransferase